MHTIVIIVFNKLVATQALLLKGGGMSLGTRLPYTIVSLSFISSACSLPGASISQNGATIDTILICLQASPRCMSLIFYSSVVEA